MHVFPGSFLFRQTAVVFSIHIFAPLPFPELKEEPVWEEYQVQQCESLGSTGRSAGGECSGPLSRLGWDRYCGLAEGQDQSRAEDIKVWRHPGTQSCEASLYYTFMLHRSTHKAALMHFSAHVCHINPFNVHLGLDRSPIRLSSLIFVAVLKTQGEKSNRKAIRHDLLLSIHIELFWYLPALFIDQFMIYQFNSAAVDASSADILR